jgi:hypothetical protein
MSSTTLEVAVQCAASLARVATGAYDIGADRYGEVRIQGKATEMPADLPELLGLTFSRTHSDGAILYTVYTGKGRGIYSDMDVRLVLASDAMPAVQHDGSMTTTTLDPTLVANWLDARAALAFEDTQCNRDAESLWRSRLGVCACGKPATHLFADEDGQDWPCRVPVAQ